MNEYEFMINKNPSLGDKTRVNYLNLYKRIIAILENTIHETPNVDLIKIIKNFNCSSTAKNALLNVVVKIKQAYNIEIDELIKFRNWLFEQATKDKVEQNLILQETLPTFQELKKYVFDLYTNGQYKLFIVNFLLFQFGCRNIDCDCLISYEGKRLSKKENWLNVKKTGIEWIRNKYKTASTYGQKKNLITNAKFIDAITKLNITEQEPLLTIGTGRVPDAQLAQTIQRMTINKIGEGKVFKILVENSTVAGLTRLSKNRGTNIATIISAYNLHEDPITDED